MPKTSTRKSLAKRIEIAGRRLLMKFFSLMQPKETFASLPDGYRPRKILLMRHDRMGDMVVTLPFFRALQKELPDTKMAILASRSNRAILKHENGFAAIIYDKRPWKFLASLWKVFAFHPDVVIDLLLKESTTSTLYVLASRAQWRIRPKVQVRLPYNIYIPIGDDWQIRREMETLIGAVAKASTENVSAEIALSEVEEAFAIRYFGKIHVPKNRLVGVNISSGVSTRMLAEDENIGICRHLRNVNRTPVLLYSPRHEALAKRIALSAPGTMVSPKTPDILHAAALLKHLALLITPDTSMVHIASACGVPVVGIYTANDWNCRRWLPWGVPYRFVQSKEIDTLRGIEFSEFFGKLDELLKEIAR